MAFKNLRTKKANRISPDSLARSGEKPKQPPTNPNSPHQTATKKKNTTLKTPNKKKNLHPLKSPHLTTNTGSITNQVTAPCTCAPSRGSMEASRAMRWPRSRGTAKPGGAKKALGHTRPSLEWRMDFLLLEVGSGWMNQCGWSVILRINGFLLTCLLIYVNGIWIGVYKPSYKPLIY